MVGTVGCEARPSVAGKPADAFDIELSLSGVCYQAVVRYDVFTVRSRAGYLLIIREGASSVISRLLGVVHWSGIGCSGHVQIYAHERKRREET